jgi:hypothetical protein
VTAVPPAAASARPGVRVRRLTYPPGPTLPMVAGLVAGQRYLGWSFGGVDAGGRLVHLAVSAGGCTSPIGTQIIETPAAVSVGVVGPATSPHKFCADDLVIVVLSFRLQRPLGARHLNALVGS